jgi:hypothetical protein
MQSPGSCSRVIRRQPDVSEGHIASIFGVEEQDKQETSNVSELTFYCLIYISVLKTEAIFIGNVGISPN